MNIPREFIAQLLSGIDLVDLINMHLPLQKKSGNNYFARCPFHQEKSASFSVSQTKQFYHCFGCGAHGNAIDFVMQSQHLNFPEAVESLARQQGLSLPNGPSQMSKQASLSPLFELMEKAVQFYSQQLRQSPKAIQYLRGRGIQGAIAKEFHLGHAPPGWDNLLHHLGKTEEDKKKCLEAGLLVEKEEGHRFYDRFRDRIIFPIQDHRGRTVGFGGRVLDQSMPKYLNSPETPLFKKGQELYGLYQVLKHHHKLNRILVVEGYMDVVSLFQQGITYAVATLGTATTATHLHRLSRYTEDIVFCFDGDPAGRQAAWRALEVLFPLLPDNIQVRFLFLPEGEDPDSLVRKEGKLLFEKRLSSALSLSAFFFQTLGQQYDLTTLEGRARLATSALHYIKQVPAGVLFEMLIDELAKRARIDGHQLKRQINHPKAGPLFTAPSTPPTTATGTEKQALKAPMKMALALLVQQPELAHLVTTPLAIYRLAGHEFLRQLLGLIQQTPDIKTTGLLIEHWRGQKEGNWVEALAAFEHAVPSTGTANEFLGTLHKLDLLGIEEEINALRAKAEQNELAPAEKQAWSDWIRKKTALKEAR